MNKKKLKHKFPIEDKFYKKPGDKLSIESWDPYQPLFGLLSPIKGKSKNQVNNYAIQIREYKK